MMMIRACVLECGSALLRILAVFECGSSEQREESSSAVQACKVFCANVS